jgi:hypothetical protein
MRWDKIVSVSLTILILLLLPVGHASSLTVSLPNVSLPNATVAETFQTDVKITNGASVHAWQVVITYAAGVVNATDITFAPYWMNGSNGISARCMNCSASHVFPNVGVAFALYGNQVVANNNVLVLFTITWQILNNTGSSNLSFLPNSQAQFGTLFLDGGNTAIPFTPMDGSFKGTSFPTQTGKVNPGGPARNAGSKPNTILGIEVDLLIEIAAVVILSVAAAVSWYRVFRPRRKH